MKGEPGPKGKVPGPLKGVTCAGHEEQGGRGRGRGREKTMENTREVVAVDVRHPINEPPCSQFLVNGIDEGADEARTSNDVP